MDFTFDIGEDEGHSGRAVGHNEILDPVEKTFAWLHMAGFGRDPVAGSSKSKLTRVAGREIGSSHLMK